VTSARSPTGLYFPDEGGTCTPNQDACPGYTPPTSATVQTGYEGGFADAILSVIDSIANYATSAGSSTPAYTLNLEGSFNNYWDSRFGILPDSADSQLMRCSSDIYQAGLAAIPVGEAISAASDALRAGDAIDATWAFTKALLSADRDTVPEVTDTAPAADSGELSDLSPATAPEGSQAEALRAAVEQRYQEVIANQSIRVRGPVLSGAMNTSTGEIFFGQNTGIPDPLTAQLRSALDEFQGPPAAGKGNSWRACGDQCG
jgi:hypothetical protein